MQLSHNQKHFFAITFLILDTGSVPIKPIFVSKSVSCVLRANSTDRDKLTANQWFRYTDFVTK